MTNQHHIVPSPEQVDQWFDDAVQLNSTPKYYIARQAALWGAARRPKLPSLKRVALLQLDTLNADLGLEGKGVDLSQIRRALEALDD